MTVGTTGLHDDDSEHGLSSQGFRVDRSAAHVLAASDAV